MLRIGKGLLATALAASAVAALAGCGGDSPAPAAAGGQTAAGQSTASVVPGCSTAPPPTAANPKRYDAPPPMTIDPAKTYTATMETSCGRIVIALDPRSAPKTVNSFVFLARQGFYDGLTFHRVVRDFVIQGGDPTGTGSGDAGYEFEDELPTDGYEVGSLAMANSGPNTNGSQFFIVTGTAGTNLPNSYSRFGKVTSGMQAAKRIESLASPDAPQDDPAAQRPRQTAWIYSVTIAEK